jgi:formylglycine-generating enzyme required for sulfatase activity
VDRIELERRWAGQALGGATIGRLLGRGRIGASFLALGAADGREQVVTLLHPGLAESEQAAERFLEEAGRARDLNDPGACPVRAAGRSDDGTPFCVRDYVAGESLADRLGRSAPPVAWTMALAIRLAETLAAAHACNLLHRSLHPGNVFLPGDAADAVVVDFGVGRALDFVGDDFEGFASAAVRPYLAPEQLRGAPLDARADLYALGAILFHCVSGSPPETVARHDLDSGTFSRRVADAPGALVRVIERLLNRSPAGRPESAREVVATLRHIASLAPEVRARPASVGATQAIRLEAAPREEVLLPAGSFMRGRDDRHRDQRPVLSVHVSSFYIDKRPVTHADYAAFLRAIHSLPDPHVHCHPDEPPEKDHTPGVESLWARDFAWKRGRPPRGMEDCPVVIVDWFDAFAYAAWAGRRLPTEAEWEYAAGGLHGMPYPWGEQPPTAQHASCADRDRMPSPVGLRELGASPEGVEELLGNTWEWVHDLYDPRYYGEGGLIDPCNETAGNRRVARGGSFRTHRDAVHRAERKSFDPTERILELGFRCARDIDDDA